MFSGLFAQRRQGPASPASAVEALRAAVAAARAGAPDAKPGRAADEIGRAVAALKTILFGACGAGGGGDAKEPPSEADVASLTALACVGDVLPLLARNLPLMQFETRKDAVQVFNNLLRRGVHGASPAPDGNGSSGAAAVTAAAETARERVGDAAAPVAAVVAGGARPIAAAPVCTTTVEQVAKDGGDLLASLVACYDDTEIALNSGAMLRECLRDESLARLLLELDVFWRFFELVEKSDFDVASDAFTSFKDLLTHHQVVAATFIIAHLDRFVAQYNGLLRSSNYYTRRQSLKLLGEMLMERANFKIMTQYISSPDNLKLIMNLLLDSRKNIQFEAFHVFKVFVANPNKPDEIRQILVRNKEKMSEYLSDFLVDRDDEQFHVDRNQILDEIRALT